MKDTELKQIFMAHPTEFAAKALQFFCKNQGVETYLLDNLCDFSYLIADFSPGVIIIHEDLLSKFKDDFSRELGSFGRDKVIVILKSSDPRSFEGYERYITEPFRPENFLEIVKQALESSVKSH